MNFFTLFSQNNNSELFNEKTFYAKFLKDLESARKSILIESPFIVSDRMDVLTPVFQRVLKKGIHIEIVTRDPVEHEDEYFRHQATNEILKLAELGVKCTLLRGYHHRKLAAFDNEIVWIGSLNILSHVTSLEIMTRITNKKLAVDLMKMIKN